MDHQNSFKEYDSNRSRREFLRLLGAGGFGSVLNGLSGCSRKVEDPAEEVNDVNTSLLLYGTGTLDIGAGWDKLKSDLNINLKFTDNNNDTGPVITQMVTQSAASEYDLGGLQGGAEAELAEVGAIIPWDLNKIPNWQHVWPLVRNIPYAKVKGQQYGIPMVINADSMIYLPDKVGTIDTYAAVFDPKLKGKTSMEDAWINSVIFTAIYLKENSIVQIHDPGNLMEDELGAVMEFLIKKKRDGQFRKLWNGWEDGLELITSGEVWVMTGWEPIVYAAKQKGVNAMYAIPKEGYEGWSNDLLLHRGAEERGVIEQAHAFANWELGGYYGCKLSKMRGYVVPADTAVSYAVGQPDLFDTKKIEETSQHVKDKFVKMGGRAYWQNVRPTLYKSYEEWWSKLRSA